MKPETERKHCGLCEHSVFSVLWGEYKCVKTQRYVYHPDEEAAACPNFKERGKDEQRVSKESRDENRN